MDHDGGDGIAENRQRSPGSPYGEPSVKLYTRSQCILLGIALGSLLLGLLTLGRHRFSVQVEDRFVTFCHEVVSSEFADSRSWGFTTDLHGFLRYPVGFVWVPTSGGVLKHLFRIPLILVFAICIACVAGPVTLRTMLVYIRAKHQLCSKCGYPFGLNAPDLCSECGIQLVHYRGRDLEKLRLRTRMIVVLTALLVCMGFLALANPEGGDDHSFEAILYDQ